MLATRKLGRQGLEVTALGLGTMGMSGVAGMPNMYGPPDDAESLATIARAVELGVSFFDTAQVYGPYHNEDLLGRALTGVPRSRVVIATKFGFKLSDDGKAIGLDSRPENVRAAIDGCLKRLRTDYIDLWYQHRLDRNVPIEDTVGVMADQVRAGKVRYLGLSEVGVATIRRAHAVHPISALQSEYSLWERNIEGPVLSCCRELGIGVVPYSPLGRGFLTGKVGNPEQLGSEDYRRLYDPRFQAANYAANQAIVDRVSHIAANHQATAAQVALAWLLAQGADIVPIPGTKQRRWLQDNLGALRVQLTAEDLASLRSLLPPQGARYSEKALAAIDR
jgi:aryl-alcohol dehydrogenase-like predicted oxidoreductase